MSARSRPWDFPSPRARTPPGAIPTRLIAHGSNLQPSPERDTSRPAHRCRSRSAAPRASNAGRRFLRARPRVSAGFAVRRPVGVATSDASDRRLHSETVPTRALVRRRFPARLPTRAMPCDTSRGHPSFRQPRGHRARPGECLFRRRARPSEDARSRTPDSSGPSDARTRLGRAPFHGGALTSASGLAPREV